MADILLGNVRGPEGPEGRTGATGETGQAATIEIGSVSTTAYGNPAQVVNSGTDEAAILDFTIPQGKPGEQTTRMGALTLDTITAQTATFPVPAVGETGATVFGKIIKFFTDTVSALASKLNVSDVINNLTSTATDKPLSANMGRQLNSNLSTKADASEVNAVTTSTFSPLTSVGHTVTDNTIVRLGHICFGACRIVATGTNDWPATANIFRAPEGFRPKYKTYIGGMLQVTGVGLVSVVTYINPDGIVTLNYSNNARTTQFYAYGVWWAQ